MTGTVKMSRIAARTVNPIRRIVNQLKEKPNPNLSWIPLSIGDPTVFGNFTLPKTGSESLQKLATGYSNNGYVHSAGTEEAREAIARKFSFNPKYPITANDVVLTAGCSGALDIAFSVLADPGKHNILIPRPGFSLYLTQLSSRGIQHKYYDLIPERQWECDIAQLDTLVDKNTACILINNPSNPCGSNYTRKHIEDLTAMARKHKLPIIADEIYAHMVFSGQTFTSFDEISNDVPILTVGGLAKQYMVPGWRVGWLIANDRQGQLSEIRQGMYDLSTITLGTGTLTAAMVKPLLEETPEAYYREVNRQLEEQALTVFEELKDEPGLKVVKPEAAMYVMMSIDTEMFKLKDDVEFTNELIKSHSVGVLPGQCFEMKNFIRIVITPPKDKLREACSRIRDFCAKRRSIK